MQCIKCGHLQAIYHDRQGCKYSACDCVSDLPTISLRQFFKQLLKQKQADPLADEPWWHDLMLYVSISPTILSGALLGALTGYFIARPAIEFFSFIALLVALNIFSIVLVRAADNTKVKRLRSKLRDHEDRIKKLEDK